MNTDTRNCLTCGKPLKGRVDKKFCDDYCRSNYNNSVNSDSSAFMKRVNNTLRKNRRILLDLIPQSEETAIFPKEKLLQLGFSFQYFTHQLNTQKGDIYHFCYEAGYLAIEGDRILLVKRKEK